MNETVLSLTNTWNRKNVRYNFIRTSDQGANLSKFAYHSKFRKFVENVYDWFDSFSAE